MIVENRIGQKIRALRLKHSMTQSKLALKVGIHHKTISQWEVGRMIPTEKNLNQLKSIFSLSDNEFETLTTGIKLKRVVTPKNKEKVREQRVEALRVLGNDKLSDLEEDDPRLLVLRKAYGAL